MKAMIEFEMPKMCHACWCSKMKNGKLVCLAHREDRIIDSFPEKPNWCPIREVKE